MFVFLGYVFIGIVWRNRSDQQLWKAYRHGNNTAFGQLFERHVIRLERLARSFLGDEDRARDIVMQVVCDFLEKNPADRKQLNVKGRVVDYLQTSVKNKAIKELKMHASMKPMMGNHIIREEVSPAFAFEWEAEDDRLWQYLESLDEETRSKVWKNIQRIAGLTEFEWKVWQLRSKKLSYSQISKEIGGNPGSNATLNTKANKKMKDHKKQILDYLNKLSHG